MKVQITTKVEMFVVMEVEVPDTNHETLERAKDEIMSNTGTDLVHESIVEVEMGTHEVSGHTHIDEPIPSKYHFRCEVCRKVHKIVYYAVAQLASGNNLIHTCDCGNTTDLEPSMLNDE